MVDFSIAKGKLILHVRGTDKLWALKSSLEIPLSGVRVDPSVAHGWYHGIRMPGANIPGVITAGNLLSARATGLLGCSQSRYHRCD